MSKTEEKINKYDNSKIFKIISDTQPDKIYYGSTLEKSLRKVLSIHKTKYKKYIEDNNSVDYIPSFELLKNNDAEIILVEKFKCNDVDEYNQKLHNFINDPKNPNINRYRPEGYKKTEDWNDPETAGFFSRWLLWGENTLKKSIKEIEKKFNIKIHYIE